MVRKAAAPKLTHKKQKQPIKGENLYAEDNLWRFVEDFEGDAR